MKKEELRKVKISKYEDGSGEYIINGFFHKWIEKSIIEEVGLIKMDYALIELEDGKVKLITPIRIKFIESF